MSTSEYERWTALEIRRPDQVRTEAGGPIPLSWQAGKRQAHADRLANNVLPPAAHRRVELGDAGDALATIALGAAMREDLERDVTWRVREAAELGATWSEIATALDVSPGEARDRLHEWADGQHHLYREDVAAGRPRPFGIDADEHAALVALIDRSDDERDPA